MNHMRSNDSRCNFVIFLTATVVFKTTFTFNDILLTELCEKKCKKKFFTCFFLLLFFNYMVNILVLYTKVNLNNIQLFYLFTCLLNLIRPK